jgi:hypothetical protein
MEQTSIPRHTAACIDNAATSGKEPPSYQLD